MLHCQQAEGCCVVRACVRMLGVLLGLSATTARTARRWDTYEQVVLGNGDGPAVVAPNTTFRASVLGTEFLRLAAERGLATRSRLHGCSAWLCGACATTPAPCRPTACELVQELAVIRWGGPQRR